MKKSVYECACPFQFKVFRAEEFLQILRENRVELHPAFQRGIVHDDGWKARVIASLFTYMQPIKVVLRDLGNGYYQSIDGTQRMDAIQKFALGLLATPELYFMDGSIKRYLPSMRLQDLHNLVNLDGVCVLEDGYELFARAMNAKIMATIYDKSMTPQQARMTFKRENDSSALKDQELRNATLGLLADTIRMLARGGESDRHPLADELPNGIRMERDEFFATALWYEARHQDHEDGIYCTYANRKELDLLYEDERYQDNAKNLTPLIEGMKRRATRVCRVIRSIRSVQKVKNPEVTPLALTLMQLSYEVSDRVMKQDGFAKGFVRSYRKLMNSERVYRIPSRGEVKPRLFHEFVGGRGPEEVRTKLNALKRELKKELKTV